MDFKSKIFAMEIFNKHNHSHKIISFTSMSAVAILSVLGTYASRYTHQDTRS